MNRQNYRAAFDAVDFSPDFEERTLQKLAAMRHASEKEQNKMSMNRTKKITLLAAAAVALLAVTVSAAVLWLTPAQVAEELNDPMLAEAFQSEAAVIDLRYILVLPHINMAQELVLPSAPHLFATVDYNGQETPDVRFFTESEGDTYAAV